MPQSIVEHAENAFQPFLAPLQPPQHVFLATCFFSQQSFLHPSLQLFLAVWVVVGFATLVVAHPVNMGTASIKAAQLQVANSIFFILCPCCLVAIKIRFVGALDRQTQVICLFRVKRRELYADFI